MHTHYDNRRRNIKQQSHRNQRPVVDSCNKRYHFDTFSSPALGRVFQGQDSGFGDEIASTFQDNSDESGGYISIGSSYIQAEVGFEERNGSIQPDYQYEEIVKYLFKSYFFILILDHIYFFIYFLLLFGRQLC